MAMAKRTWCLQVEKATWKQCSGCLSTVQAKMCEKQTDVVKHPCGTQGQPKQCSGSMTTVRKIMFEWHRSMVLWSYIHVRATALLFLQFSKFKINIFFQKYRLCTAGSLSFTSKPLSHAVHVLLFLSYEGHPHYHSFVHRPQIFATTKIVKFLDQNSIEATRGWNAYKSRRNLVANNVLFFQCFAKELFSATRTVCLRFLFCASYSYNFFVWLNIC